MDGDGDGYFAINGSCSFGDDCGDYSTGIHPGATEYCDSVDNDCDGQVNEGCPDVDNDDDGHYTYFSHSNPRDDCNDNDPTIYPGAPELCDLKDNDCSGGPMMEIIKDQDVDGHYSTNSCKEPHDDCVDTDPDINPDAMEICGNGIDDNCDGIADGGCLTELGPQPGPSEGNVCETVCDPVDVFSGMYIYREMDMSYPYPSMVRMVRQYSSGSTVTGPFGKGTSTNYDRRLLEGSGFLTYVTPEGGSYILESNPDGSYTNTVYPFLRQARAYLSPERKLVFDGGSTYTFDDDGWLVNETDRNGNWVDIGRDAVGIINGVSDSFGRSLDITPIVVNGVTVIGFVRDALGQEVKYEYNPDVTLKWVWMPDFSLKGYEWENGKIWIPFRYEDLRNYDPIVIDAVITYDPVSGKVKKQWHPDDGEYIINYQETGGGFREVEVKSPVHAWTTGIISTYTLNKLGYITKINVKDTAEDPYGWTTYYERAPGTNDVVKLKEPVRLESRTTSYTYENGIVNSVTDPSGNTILFQYEDPSVLKPTRITDARGDTTTLAYDSNGNITDISLPGISNAVHMTYNQWGLVNTVTNALDETVSIDYHSHGMIANITDSLDNVSSFEYDAIGRIINSTDPMDRTTLYAYSDGGRTVEITDPLQRKTTVTYTSKGDLLSVTDAKNQTVSYEYNGKDTVETVTDQLQQTETYEYDKRDRILNVLDREGRQIQYRYPDKDSLRLYYEGNLVQYYYDSLGRLTRVHDSGMEPVAPPSWHIRMDYTLTPPECVEGVNCDAFPDRVKRVETPQGVVNYTYDEVGRRASMTVEGQPEVNYTYTPDGLLKSISTTNPLDGATPMNFSFTYDEVGRRKGIVYPNLSSGFFSYDGAGRVENVAYKSFYLFFPYFYNIDSVSYTYDANGDLKSMYRPTCDPLLPGITNATYNGANRMITFNGESLTYDANGNLTQKGDMVFTWDVLNRLVAIANSPGGDASFEYDPLGRRVKKTVDGVTTQYLYDGLDIVAELDGAGNVKAYYIRNLDIDEPLARIDFVNNSIQYYHADAQGSILALSRDGIFGLTTARYTYSPYGKTEITYDTEGAGAANPFRYTGREEDETGLYYYRARYYSPEMRRFISEDPVRFAGGVNFYSYVGNSPVNWVDPLGLEPDIHTDINPKTGEKYKHYGKYRFNERGQVVTHDGRLIKLSKAEARGARKALRLLRAKIPDFFKIGGLVMGIILELADPAVAEAPTIMPRKCHYEPADVTWQ